ncbi:MAG: hypothetical protein M0C28_48695 [Candidatus Moduliflexus flocculans]|nr:hypothetical protein [Candidatus Moduliflexus flocculans]
MNHAQSIEFGNVRVPCPCCGALRPGDRSFPGGQGDGLRGPRPGDPPRGGEPLQGRVDGALLRSARGSGPRQRPGLRQEAPSPSRTCGWPPGSGPGTYPPSSRPWRTRSAAWRTSFPG